MKKLLCALLLTLFPLVASAGTTSLGVSAERLTETNFLVNTGCSGTWISKERRLILTAHHCITQQFDTVERERVSMDGTVKKEKVRIAKPGSVTKIHYKGPNEVQRDSYVYKVKAYDSARDIAVLEVQAEIDLKPVTLACNEPGVLDTVYAVGNSYGILYSTVTKGIVSSVSRSYRDMGLVGGAVEDATDDGEHGFTQHSAVIIGGNSGGALVDEQGELVGMNVRGGASGFSFSVPLPDLKRFMHAHEMESLVEHCK